MHIPGGLIYQCRAAVFNLNSARQRKENGDEAQYYE
jgi:hypothetical protein